MRVNWKIEKWENGKKKNIGGTFAAAAKTAIVT